MKQQRRDSRLGETIVEVMVSAVIFLILMAILQGAVMFSNAAQKKSQQIRQDTATICKELQSATAVDDEENSYSFYAVSTDETIVGDKVFTIPVKKQKKPVTYTGADGESSEVTFYMFGGVTP